MPLHSPEMEEGQELAWLPPAQDFTSQGDRHHAENRDQEQEHD